MGFIHIKGGYTSTSKSQNAEISCSSLSLPASDDSTSREMLCREAVVGKTSKTSRSYLDFSEQNAMAVAVAQPIGSDRH